MNRTIVENSSLIFQSATELAALVSAGSVSSREVVAAHIARIEQINPQLNAVTIRLFDEALLAAEQADRLRQKGERLGPLHGVPITVKECFYLAGTDSTIGISRFRKKPVAQTSPHIDRLTAAGAILLGKTNVPQMMLLHETDNPVYGRTNNPWDLERGAGGSSGGEAAIIAACGSPLGLGNDLGGSIRQPAHVCGITGLMPTSRLLTNRGARDCFTGMLAMRSVPGPMARRVADLQLGLRALLTGPRCSSEAIHPFQEKLCSEPLADNDISQLRIGIVQDDGFFRPAPAIRRAVQEAAALVESQGAVVEPFSLAQVPEMMRIYLGILSSDALQGVRDLLQGSDCDWRIKRNIHLATIPGWLRPWVASLYAMCGQVRTAELIRWTGRRSVYAYRQLCGELQRYTAEFVEQMQARSLDAILLPPYGLAALPHGSTSELLSPASYCFLANLLGMPAGTVPVTRVRAEEQSEREDSRDRVVRAAIAAEQGSAGLPVGVQVLGNFWREDQVLAIMRVIESSRQERFDSPLQPNL